MIDDLLSILLERTFTKSELSYRIGVVKEFLEYAFFKEHQEDPSKDSLPAFAKEVKKHEEDLHFLESLPDAFFASFSQDTFYKELGELSEKVHEMRVVGLTVPVALTRSDTEAIGNWVRKNLASDVLLDTKVDDSIAVGCQILWKSRLYDFGLDHYLSAHDKELSAYLLKRTTPQKV